MIKKFLFVIITVLVAFFYTGCKKSDSLAKEKFDILQKYVSDSENAIRETNDYKIKLEICQNVISSIDDFINEVNDEKLIASVKEMRSIWFDKAFGIFQEFMDDYENAITTIYKYEEKMELFKNVILSIDDFIETSNDEKLIDPAQ